MSQFTDLDNAIVATVAAGVTTFAAINERVKNLAAPFGKGAHDTFRVTDRRLQALRKRGRLEFTSKEWRVATFNPFDSRKDAP